MNNRQKELLRILLTNTANMLHVELLSDKLNCSEKTVRNDLKHVEEFLKQYPSAALVRKPGIGLRLDIDKQDQAEIFQKLFQVDTKTDDERIIEIAYQLLISDKPITLKDLAERYYTNRAHIKNDLDDMQQWLERFDLELVSKQRIGNTISGSEMNKRNALAHLSELTSSASERNYVLDLFPPYEIQTVRRLLNEMQDNYQFVFTDGGFESLLIHSLIMIRRIRQGSPIAITDVNRDATFQTKEYGMALWVLEQMEKAFRISFPENERIYFTWHLISSKTKTDVTSSIQPSSELLEKVVDALTARMQFLTMVNFKNDTVLLDGLRVHLHTVINRIAYGFTITNPMLVNIKKMYPYMFSMIVFALEDMKETFQLDIPEDEAAYLVLHFQASIERLHKTRSTTKRVLIVCHMGVGMSRLLQAKLEQNYKGIHVLDCIGKMELDTYLENHSVDFIVSTVPLENVEVPSIVISPLFEAKDKEKLNQFFQEQESDNARKGSLLDQLLDTDSIHLNVELEHRFEVVEMLGNHLLKKGAVDMLFVHSALLRERASATEIGGAVAIPHARPDTVKRSAVAMAVMKQPIEWGNEMVSVVFLLAIAKENQSQTKEIIQQISEISEQPVLVKELTEVKTPPEIKTLLKN